MVWLNTKPAVAASRIGAMPGTAERSSRVWAVMSETRGGDSALSPPGHHDDVATGPPRCVRGASGASPGPTTASAVTAVQAPTPARRMRRRTVPSPPPPAPAAPTAERATATGREREGLYG